MGFVLSVWRGREVRKSFYCKLNDAMGGNEASRRQLVTSDMNLADYCLVFDVVGVLGDLGI